MSAKCAPRAKKSKFIFLGILGGYAWLAFATLHPPLPNQKTPLIFYSNQLRDDLKRVVVRAIKEAKSSITIQIYGLTDPDLLALLEKRRAEGINVTIFYDKKASKFVPDGIPVKATGLMHRKILVVDKKLVLVGTANFTTHSLKMHDNLVLGICDPIFATFLEESIDLRGDFDIDGTAISGFLLPDFENQAIKKLLRSIDSASEEIVVAMFTLTHPQIIDKLIAAKKRGVSLKLAVDRYTAEGASLAAVEKLKNAGATILISSGNQLLHHKWALIDGKTLIFGSANWTKAAFSKNQDCLLILESLSEKEQKKLKKLWRNVEIASKRG